MPKRKLTGESSLQKRETNRKYRRRIIISDTSSSSSEEEKNQSHTRAAATDTPLDTPGGTTEADLPEIETELELDPELLSALDERTEVTNEIPDFGEKIHQHLANLWLPILKKELATDNKETLLRDYPVPCNCKLLQAPKLNAEISAAIPDLVRHRDKKLCTLQQQLGAGVTAINRAMDILLRADNKADPSLSLALKHISNGCRILSDLHFANTQNRAKLITQNLDKKFLHVIKDAERDDTIFGEELSNKIKAAKAIEKQGLQIKKGTNQKPLSASSSSQPSTSRAAFQGNWTAPPRYPSNRGGRGGAHSRPSPPRRRPYTTPASRAAGQTRTRTTASRQ